MSDNKENQLSFYSQLFLGDSEKIVWCDMLEDELADLRYFYACVDTLYFLNGESPTGVLKTIHRAMEMNRLLMYVCSRDLYHHKNKSKEDYSSDWEYYNNHYMEMTQEAVLKMGLNIFKKVQRDSLLFAKKYSHQIIKGFHSDYLKYLTMALNKIKKDTHAV